MPSCLVDTTFVETKRPYLNTHFYYNSHKNKYGIVYQVACSLGKPFRIVHFSGPKKGGCSDVSILRSTLLPLLRNGEKIMCDKAYLAESRCWTAPKGKFQTLTREGKGNFIDVARIRQLNERLIGRLSQWGVFSKKWNLSFALHQLCANVAAKLTQLQCYTNPLT